MNIPARRLSAEVGEAWKDGFPKVGVRDYF